MRWRASTASTIDPDGLRITDDEFDAGRRRSGDVDAAIDDAIAHLRAFNEQQLARTTRLVRSSPSRA